jgi:hypothetical protein
MSTTNQKNSFVSIAEQVALLSKNSIETLSKLNDIVSSQASAVSIKYIDENGVESFYSLPTTGYLKKEIDLANTNIKRLSTFQDKSTYIIDGESTKKLYQIDLNREPEQIGTINNVSQFIPVNNWFFESLSSPLLTVELDLTDLIEDDVTKILSRRYVVNFTRDSEGNLTQKGLDSLNDFKSKFLNRNDVDINEFVSWMNNSTNTGVVGNNNPEAQVYDEQIFTFEYNQLADYGVFSVLKQEVDSLNKKLWYHVNTITYFDNTGKSKTLSVGDQLILNKTNSTTRYVIHEVNTSASNYRLLLERVEGYDPVPTSINALKYYSGVKLDKKVKISIGFDEYNVVFLKSINGSNNIISTLWSKGLTFYSNDLKLASDSTVNLSTYYLDAVFDYGALLKDLIKKNIPSDVGLTPNVPVLDSDNFKVVQINKHITDTSDTQKLRDLHSQKNSVKTQVDQLNESISLKQKELQRKQYKTVAERSQAENELTKLNAQLDNASKLLNSITTQITSSNIDTTASPKYAIRGFWEFPESRKVDGYRDQEVVQFKIQYRYSSKSGTENTTEGYQLKSTNSNTTQTAYYSNWVQVLSDARQRYYDETTQEWLWKIEDVSDADTPNINQLNISITKGEKVEIRVKSISEVGWPTSNIESEWSDTLTVEFPDELGSILDSNDFILQEATNDSLKIEFEGTLDSKGYTQHVSESFTANQTYFAHKDTSIQTSFVDENLNSLSLYDYLKKITDKINSLEEIVAKANGILQVLVYNNDDYVEVSNGATIQYSLNIESYATPSGTSRSYLNNIYLIGDYFIKINNLATNNSLGLLSDRLYQSGGTNSFRMTDNLPPIVDNNNNCIKQKDNQYIWVSDFDNNTNIYDNTGIPLNGNGDTVIASALSGDTKNVGLPDGYLGGTGSLNSYFNLIDNVNWKSFSSLSFLSTVHLSISDINSLVESGQEKIKYILPNQNITLPINIYSKLVGNDFDVVTYTSSSTIRTHTKKLKIFIETNNLNRPFEFCLVFNISNIKKVN